MKIDHFFVNGKRFEVNIKKPEDMEGAWGKLRWGAQEMRICQSAQPHLRSQIFVHELLHAISDEYHDTSNGLTEIQVLTLASGFIMFLRENPHINIYGLISEGLDTP